MESFLAQAQLVWNSPEFQALLAPVRTLSSVSAMFWMLARLADLAMAVLRKIIFEEAWALLHGFYAILLALAYAAVMFHTALQGAWHPSLLWREVCGFGFMYVMLGVTFTDGATKRLKPHTPLAFVMAVGAYLFLARAPGLVRHPGLLEFHRVLELFAAGGWGNVMTALTALVMAWSLLRLAAGELAFGISPLLYRLRIIKALPVRFDFSEGGRGAVPGLTRSWFILTLLAGGAAVSFYFWPRIKASAEAAAPAIQSRAQSPEAAEAAAKLRRVLPAVSFAAVGAMPRGGLAAELAVPVFRKLLSAPGEADRWLAAAALDRLDPAFRISRATLFSSTAAVEESACEWRGRAFTLLQGALPGDEPAKAGTWWLEDARGVHYSGVGPGEFYAVPGSSGCAAAVYGSKGGAVLLAFTEAPREPGGALQLWLAAYRPEKREVIGALRAGASAAGDFRLEGVGPGVIWADAPVSTAAAACSGNCGEVMGGAAVSLATEPLVEYRGAMVEGDAIKVVPVADRTYEASGLASIYRTQADFDAAFRLDPAAGFLNRWYRLAVLADGRRCASVALDPSLPGLQERDAAWVCGR